MLGKELQFTELVANKCTNLRWFTDSCGCFDFLSSHTSLVMITSFFFSFVIFNNWGYNVLATQAGGVHWKQQISAPRQVVNFHTAGLTGTIADFRWQVKSFSCNSYYWAYSDLALGVTVPRSSAWNKSSWISSAPLSNFKISTGLQFKEETYLLQNKKHHHISTSEHILLVHVIYSYVTWFCLVDRSWTAWICDKLDCNWLLTLKA